MSREGLRLQKLASALMWRPPPALTFGRQADMLKGDAASCVGIDAGGGRHISAGGYPGERRGRYGVTRELIRERRVMYVTRSDHFSRPCGFVLTDQGREDLQGAVMCHCIDLLVADGCFQCRECGTVYGLVFGWARAPKRSHWRRPPGGDAA